jgi:hypothetical protein
MVMVPREDIRRTLTERVASRVAGEGISRASIEAAVDGVVAALGHRSGPAVSPASASRAPAPVPDGATMIAALSGHSAPDLGSRLRAALARDGIRVAALGIATRGRHTVVTLRLPAAARQALERIAAEQSLSLSIDPSLQPPA